MSWLLHWVQTTGGRGTYDWRPSEGRVDFKRTAPPDKASTLPTHAALGPFSVCVYMYLFFVSPPTPGEESIMRNLGRPLIIGLTPHAGVL